MIRHFKVYASKNMDILEQCVQAFADFLSLKIQAEQSYGYDIYIDQEQDGTVRLIAGDTEYAFEDSLDQILSTENQK